MAEATPTTAIWKLANETLQKCHNHPEEQEKVILLSEYLDDAKEILTAAFNAGKIDKKSYNEMLRAETDWVIMQWDALLVTVEIRALVMGIERLERLDGLDRDK